MIKSFNTPAMQARRAQAGITLIEVSIGLIIAAIIAAAAFIAFQNNSRRTEVRENIANITEVSAEIKNKFLRSNSYGALTQEAALAAGVFEPLGSVSETEARNSYGGIVEIDESGNLTWAEIPQDQCVDVVLGIESGFATLTVNGEPVKSGDAVGSVLEAATDACLSAETVELVMALTSTAPTPN